MATYTSGSVSYAGISGVDMDFEDLIDKLYSIESIQANKLLEWRADWQLRRDAFTQVRESLVALQTALTAINSTDKFLTKSANSSNSSVVSATVDSSASPGAYVIEVNQLATSSVWSISTGISAKTDVVNDTGVDGEFTYTYKGETRTVKVPHGTTLDGLKNLINNDSENLGVRVQLIQNGDEYIFQLSGLDTGSAASLNIDSTKNISGLELGQVPLWNYLNSGTRELESLTGYASASEVLNTTETAKIFRFAVNGEEYSVKLAAGGTLTDLIDAINAKTAETGVTATLVSGAEYTLKLSGREAVTVTASGGGTLASYLSGTGYSTADDVINTSGADQTYEFTADGTTYSVTLEAGGTLNDLIAAINAQTASSGVTASLVENAGTYDFELNGRDDDLVTVGGGTLDGYFSMLGTSTWQVQQGQNAEMRVNGWPATGWLEQASNAVSEVVDGLTFNLRSEGKSTVTVELDTEAIEANVQTFVDAVNDFRTLIMELTKVDESKTVLDPDYAETQSEMQMGSALTGNYGIQLLSSRLKQAVAGSAIGFSYAKEIEGKIYGDLFNSLAQVGIITDTDESSSTFGLLVINQTSQKDGLTYVQSTGTFTLKEALAKDAEAVARLFAADNEAKSNSSSFTITSQVKTLTQPGTYDVSYETDAGGNITSATINGKEAKIDGSTISLTRVDPESSDPSVATAKTSGTVEGEYNIEVKEVATKSTSTVTLNLASATDSVVTGTDPIDFSYEYNGVTRTFEVEPGTTLNDLVSAINKDSQGNVTARVVGTSDDPPKYNLVLEAKATGANPEINIEITTAGSGPLSDAANDPTTRIEQTAGVNAEYKVWKKDETAPGAYTVSENNTITIDSGLTATLKAQGTTTIKALKHNDADGIELEIYDRTPSSTITGTFSIREGKINEILNMLSGTEGILGSSGTLTILENNYDDIIANIEAKIKKEDERLQKWLRTTKLRFSRLETVLANYQKLQASLESQIEQLKSNNS